MAFRSTLSSWYNDFLTTTHMKDWTIQMGQMVYIQYVNIYIMYKYNITYIILYYIHTFVILRTYQDYLNVRN